MDELPGSEESTTADAILLSEYREKAEKEVGTMTAIPKETIDRFTRYWIDCRPMGAVRMTQQGKWSSTSAQRYLDYKKLISWQIKNQCRHPTEFAVGVKVVFHMPIPKSWSKKKQREAVGRLHDKKPDIDNLIKGCFDAANHLIWRDDALVVQCEAEKVYSETPGIEMFVAEVF